jgi:2-polyprenyl-3-methyl-5-hydroxy-6-metoxy-1,4-benzoquinol methylase
MKAWSMLITHGLRPGDAWMIEEGKIAHKAANDLVRRFLRSNCDTLFLVDSDADFGPQALNELRDHQPGQAFDALQAFYTRRGWPPEAIWFKRNALGNLYQCLVYGEDVTQEVALIGTHCVLLRRSLLEGMRDQAAAQGVAPEQYEWFYYPRHEEMSEDAAFSVDAAAAGFRLGATTHVKFGHISRVTTGWETYQEVLELSGQNERVREYKQMVLWLSEFTGETPELVEAKIMLGSQNVREAWQMAAPQTAGEVSAFYGLDTNGYLYDLAAWNTTPHYLALLEPLKSVTGQRVLVFGAGLGTECAALADKNSVWAFDVPGVLRDFCTWRPDRQWMVMPEATLSDALAGEPYDLIVALDVIEHLHPDEFESTLDTLLRATRPGGRWYVHVSFSEFEKYPMHFEHGERWQRWLTRRGLTASQSGNALWLEREMEFTWRS